MISRHFVVLVHFCLLSVSLGAEVLQYANDHCEHGPSYGYTDKKEGVHVTTCFPDTKTEEGPCCKVFIRTQDKPQDGFCVPSTGRCTQCVREGATCSTLRETGKPDPNYCCPPLSKTYGLYCGGAPRTCKRCKKIGVPCTNDEECCAKNGCRKANGKCYGD